jgi:hypothetical protein
MADRYGLTGNWNSTGSWSATDGGASGASFPVAGDRVFLTSNTGTITVNVSSACGDFTMTGGTLAGSSALAIDGSSSWGGTISYTGTITYKATATGKTIANNGKTLASNIVFDGVGGGWTRTDAGVTTGSITLTNGAFSDGGFSVTCSSFLSNNSNVRSLTKNGNWTITGSGTIVNFTTTTNLTATFDNTKDWLFTYTGATTTAMNFSSSGLAAVGNLKFSGSGTYSAQITGNHASGTFRNIDFTGFAGTYAGGIALSLTGDLKFANTMAISGTLHTITFVGSGTQTITSAGNTLNKALTIAGTGTVQLADALNTGGQILTLTSGGFNDGGFSVTTGSFSSSNANVRSITKTVQWNITGTGTCVSLGTITNLTASFASAWNLTNSSATARTFGGGALALGELKISAGTMAQGVGSTGATFTNIDFTGFSGSWSAATSGSVNVTGDLTLSATMTVTDGTPGVSFTGTGLQTITSNGVALNRSINVNGTGNTVKLADTYNSGTRNILVIGGTFDSNQKTITAAQISPNGASAAKVITITNSDVTLTGTTTVFGVFSSTVSTTTVNALGSTIHVGSAWAVIRSTAATTWAWRSARRPTPR